MSESHQSMDIRADTLPHAIKCSRCGAASPPNSIICAGCDAPLGHSIREPGTILGSYRLLDVIGQGGMGVVYLAEHVRLGRRVAIKMLRAEYTDNRTAVHRFFAEARAVNKICHQNIVEITDFVEQPGGDNYYIMELLQGTSLAALIDSHGPPTLERTIGIMTQVASALETVHTAGIVHRDLKPDNVFLIERSGQHDFVKLLDFGVAKLGQIAEIATHTTAVGAILGTPEYMSPEQASGKPVDFRTDIYAYGVLLYEMVTGKLPVSGGSFGELVVKHLTVEPTPPTKVAGAPHVIPPALEDVILACLAKDPSDRPADMKTVADRLFEIADAEGWSITSFRATARTTGNKLIPLHRPRSSPSINTDAAVVPKRKTRTLALAIALAVTITFAVAYVVLGRNSEQPAETKPATIELVFQSTPAGAEVFRQGETVPLGKTPLTLTFPQSDRSETFELRLGDHDPVTHSVRLDRSAGITSQLVKRAPPPPPPEKIEPKVIDVVIPEKVDPKKPDPKKPPIVIKKVDPKKPDPKKPDPDPTAGSGSGTNPGDRSGVLDPFAPKKK